MTRSQWFVSCTIVAGLGLSLAAQTPAPPRVAGSGDIAGQVIDGKTGAPVADAVVTLTGHGAPDRVLVDAHGHFTFSDMPPGTFGLGAAHVGFSGGGFGQRQPWDLPAPLALGDAEHRTDVILKVWRLGAIAGTITNDAGDAIANVQVQVLRRSIAGGAWQLVPAAAGTTDDRGRYRVAGLDAGTYAIAARPDLDVETPLLLALLSANPANAADVMAAVTSRAGAPEVDASVEHDAPAFYGAATSAPKPTLVELSAGGERAGVDVHLPRVRTVAVSGHVTGRAEIMESVEGLIVRLLPAASGVRAQNAGARSRLPLAPIEIASAACDDTGHFEFSAVPPGQYVIAALRVATPAPGAPQASALPAAPTLWASAPLDVGPTAARDIALRVETGRVVSGRVALSSGSTTVPAEVSSIGVRLDAVDAPPAGAPATWVGHVGADGRFSTTDVPPGRYLLRVTNVPRGWTLDSARVTVDAAARDILDEPLTVGDADVSDVVISFGDQPLGSIDGQTDARAIVIVFPVHAAQRLDTTGQSRRVRRVRPSPVGAFAVTGLPAGDYFAAAIESTLPIDWASPVWLDSIAARATRVHVADGVPATTALAVIR